MGEQVAWRASTRRVNECTEAVLEYVERQPRGQGASLGTMPLCDHSKEAVFPVDSPESQASVALVNITWLFVRTPLTVRC